MARSRLLASLGSLALGTGLGLGLMFLLDPRSGQSRRALLRARLRPAGGAGAGEGTLHALARGRRELVALLRARLPRDLDAVRLQQRVRAHVDRVASQPDAIEVEAAGGVVKLSGSVPLDELDEVIAEVATVAGVREVHNLLRAELPPPHVPGEH